MFNKHLYTPVDVVCPVNVNMTLCTSVYRQANNINMLKDGMKIEATHVKKKQLHQYLPPEVVQKKKRVRCCSAMLVLFLGLFSSFNKSVLPQSIAELNRSSNGGSSKRLSLDSSHLDSSRDTDSGTPFNSPPSKPSKPTSDTDDRYDALLVIFTVSVVLFFLIPFYLMNTVVFKLLSCFLLFILQRQSS